MKKIIKFITCRDVSNPLYVLGHVYVNIAIILFITSLVVIIFSNNYEVSNNLFKYASYALGIPILNTIVFVIYAQINDRKELLE